MRPRLTAAVANCRRAVRNALDLAPLNNGDLVLVAVSGGPDSLALAAATAFEAPRKGLRAKVIVIDHALQGGSDKVAEDALLASKALGLEGEARSVKIRKSGKGLEAEARDARYSELERARVEQGAALVLLGHTLDDQAETVLLGLTRGSGLKSIAGMSVWDPNRNLLRPLLQISRAEVLKSLSDQKIEFWNDPHNQDDRFTRVRIRKLMGLLDEQLGPGLASALSKTASIAALAEDYLESQALELEAKAKTSSSETSVHYAARELQCHPALLRQTLRRIALQLGAESLSMAQIETLAELVTNWHGQKSVPLSGITVERVNNELVFTTNKPPTAGASCS